MIKKLLTIAAFSAVFSVNAQNNLIAYPAEPLMKQPVVNCTPVSNSNAKTSVVNIGDTLWYFFYKHFYRNAPATGFFTVKSPYQSSTTPLTHFGSRFLNSGSLFISGLEAVVSRQASSPSASITVRLILCNVASGMPVLPGIDSISAVITGTAGTFIGGDFLVPKNVTSDFAVVYRNASTTPGDTIRAWINNANTASSTTTLTASKYGEGLSNVRAAGSWLSMTGTFGAGTDYEWLVAPRVGYAAMPAESSPTVTPYCTNTPYSFNNTSSTWLGHRQYNMNQFYRHWKPFSNTVTINADSVYTWNFGDGTGNFYTPTSNPSIVHTYTAAGTFNGNLIARHMKMSDSGVKNADAANFSKTVSICANVATFSGIEAVNVYPNPSTGVVNIANLPSESTIEVVNMLGQSVYKARSDAGNFNADLSTLPNGSYFVKINSVNEKTKIVKLILN